MKGFANVVGWGLAFGFFGFAAGFLGPMLLHPEANQGPMLGIFLTGPIGFALGLVFGAARNRTVARRPPPDATSAG